MTPEDSGVDREELASFLATAPEHLKGWAGEQLATARDYQRKAQFIVDYSFSENGRGFHAPAYSISILNQATDWARSGQLALRGVEVDNGVAPAIPEQHLPTGKKK